VFDPRFRRDAAVLEKVYDGDFRIGSMDADERRLIVIYASDIEPDATYLYDRSTRRAEFLFTPIPWVRTAQLSRMKPVTLKSRDGLTLHGYLTLPPGVVPKDLPMVLKVHGGPWERDRWTYDTEVQFLSNRGYAVLQVNFRGSTGYGKRFKRAAIGEFGRKMQDDLIDAVNWAVGRGIADPKRVAIYGGSYGGYATLAALAFTPDVFACGIDLVGPSSLVTLIKSFPPYWKPFLQSSWYLYVGDPDDPKAIEDMKARSPLYYAEHIMRPVLIAQGANDPRVKKAESDQIVESLRKAGKEVEYMVADNEGHGFVSPENMLKFYARMETFLAKHLAS
jgi:dipeptidyl aminopeptidase/acylaminoacyl peptidase